MIVVRETLGRFEQFVRTEGGVERHGPGPHAVVETVVITLDRRLHTPYGFVEGIDRQAQRVRLIRDVFPYHQAAARFLVRLHTGIEILRTARIQEAGRAILEEFGNAQEGRGVLVLLGHGTLQCEDVGEVDHRIEIVWEDAAGCMCIADVHVVVAEAWRHHHLTRVDHPISGDDAVRPSPCQPGRCADPR